jgi:hypothetical protein
MACKIVDLDVAANRLTDGPISNVGEERYERVRRIARGRELVMREIRILSKLSHVRIDRQFSMSELR